MRCLLQQYSSFTKMDAENLYFSKHPKIGLDYIATAKTCRELGKRSPALSRGAIRVTIAANLAESFGVTLGDVISDKKNGGNSTLYTLLSKFCSISRPRGEDAEWKGMRVDRELQSPDANWNRIVAASQGNPLDRK